MKRYESYGLPIVTDSGLQIIMGLAFLEFAYSGPIKEHRITMQESCRPDLLAFKFYSDAGYWPFLAWMNNIKDPLSGFYHLALQTDRQGNLVLGLDGNPVMVPNVIVVPTDKSALTASIIPHTYAQV